MNEKFKWVLTPEQQRQDNLNIATQRVLNTSTWKITMVIKVEDILSEISNEASLIGVNKEEKFKNFLVIARYYDENIRWYVCSCRLNWEDIKIIFPNDNNSILFLSLWWNQIEIHSDIKKKLCADLLTLWVVLPVYTSTNDGAVKITNT